MSGILHTIATMGLTFYIIAGIGLLGILFMFLMSRAPGGRLMIALVSIFTSLVTFVHYTGLSSAFNMEKIITLALAVLGLLALILGLTMKKPNVWVKILTAIGAAGSFVYLWFF